MADPFNTEVKDMEIDAKLESLKKEMWDMIELKWRTSGDIGDLIRSRVKELAKAETDVKKIRQDLSQDFVNIYAEHTKFRNEISRLFSRHDMVMREITAIQSQINSINNHRDEINQNITMIFEQLKRIEKVVNSP